MRFIGLDLGNKTLGIALSDANNILVSPFENFEFKNRDFMSAAKRVVQLCSEFQVSTVALGDPKNMDGTPSDRSRISLKFKAFILSLNPLINVELVDERLTSVEARNILKECEYSENKKGRVRDSIAACLILESYLASFSQKTKQRD